MTLNASFSRSHRCLGEDSSISSRVTMSKCCPSDHRAQINAYILELISNTKTLLKCPAPKHMIPMWVCVHTDHFQKNLPKCIPPSQLMTFILSNADGTHSSDGTPHWSPDFKLWFWFKLFTEAQLYGYYWPLWQAKEGRTLYMKCCL